MKGAKGLAVLMADSGWHGTVTGSCVESRIPSQVLGDISESMLRRMRPDMLLIEKHTSDDVPPTLRDLEIPQHRKTCRVHAVQLGFCTEVAYAQKFKDKFEQHCILVEHLRNAEYADHQLHLLVLEKLACCSNSQHCI